MPTLEWIGKKAVVNHHREVPFRLLQCDPALSVGDPDSGNLLVQGDNLEALKALLPYYAGKVKCIYIDPPYNTGVDERDEQGNRIGWVYSDNVNSPEIRAWLHKVVGNEMEDLSRHDKWLCMMYPRLALLREFLSEDGAIFISIDDIELASLLHLCDEVFGLANRLAVFTWVRKKKGSNLSKEFRKITEYIICYKKSATKTELYGAPAYAQKEVPLLNRPNPVSRLTFPPGVVRAGRGLKEGPIKAGTFGEGELQVELENDICIRDGVIASSFVIKGRFRWSQSTVDYELENGSVFTASSTFRFNVARFNQASKFKAPSSLISNDDGVGTNEDATEELRNIFTELAKLPFDYPKPSSLIQYFVRAATKDDIHALVLDSFAGSGTTGHAVLAQNKADGGKRRFILVEMDPKICREVTAERLKRVIEGYGDQEPLGGGFRYCTLGEPLFDETGAIRESVKFHELAAHVFFTETGSPIPKEATGKTPLLGIHKGVAVYLLFNGVLGDKRPQGGNVLTRDVLASLPPHDGPKVIYGESCRLGAARLRQESITFKQVPYDIQVR
jgi:site-specific DNA-methyltransferase (adenine-specific)/adenine-specific DNA-methyltransferase